MEQSINQRVKQICDYYFSGNTSAMAREVLVKQSTIRDIIGTKQSKPSFETLKAIVDCPSIKVSADWLLQGVGNVFDKSKGHFIFEFDDDKCANVMHIAEPEKDYVRGRPYYDVDFLGGFDLLCNDQTIIPSYNIDFQPFNKKDVFWCNISGKSMEPEISSGDIIALKEVQDWNDYISYGEIYAIVTNNELRTVKRVRKGSDEEHFLLVPSNKDYDAQEIEKKMILKIFSVLGSMKKF